ncbi:ATP-binding protein [Streptomyces verrucosisporus]|uniref:ATP-binding protein n=1 Tax=Streptomyces verrucosisporus TaxID=1695161 RepID=UPI0019CF89BA|nr:ATP-binding protein [Streptomyces verrucosisporus]MBN3932061.1 ATP-binding protein [Streptomyces verrucosisporus]
MRPSHCLSRKRWEIPFLAEPEGVSTLRRAVRKHLTLWGLHEAVDPAQLCVSELVANVIRHVGTGTPVTLAVSMNRTRLRIELTDPDIRALPTLLSPSGEQETGRGLALLDALAAGWGVILREEAKVTWCELETDLTAPNGHSGGKRVTRAEALLTLYADRNGTFECAADIANEENAVYLIADVLHWLSAHGHDPDTALDHAQTRFEAMAVETSQWN